MNQPSSPAPPFRFRRLPLVALGMMSLLFAIWGGLARLSADFPLPAGNAQWLVFHGPLMVCGFLGTVIGLERAVGLPHRWTYAAPLLTALGAAGIITGIPGSAAAWLVTAGSAIFAAVTWRVVQLQRVTFTVVMHGGALAWLTGNILWLCGWPFHRCVPWWIVFLCLTIVGERLNLSRFQKVTRLARPAFLVAAGLFTGGVILSALFQTAGERLCGAGMVALALWLARCDIARRNLKQPGLARFMAVCVMTACAWLAAAGLLAILHAPLIAGPLYDAALHAFFLGFVFTMIFAHAPVIFPSVLGRPISYHWRFYLHVVVLQGSLLLRMAGDLGGWQEVRLCGAILNGVAIVLFLVNTVSAMFRRHPGAVPAGAGTRGI